MNEKRTVKCSFYNKKTQSALFLVYAEYTDALSGEVTYATVLFKLEWPKIIRKVLTIPY